MEAAETLQALQLCVALVSWGLVIVFLARIARERRIGAPFFSKRARPAYFPALLGLQAGLLLVALGAFDYPALAAAVALLGGMALTWLAPTPGDDTLGELGFARGWLVLRYEQLEGWRLETARFHYKHAGRWSSIDLPSDQRGRLRLMLSRHAGAPETEREE